MMGDDTGSRMSRRDFVKTAVGGVFAGSLALCHTRPAEGQMPESEARKDPPMIQIPGGRFTMGDPSGEVDERPHEVQLDPFTMDEFLVTQEEFERVTGENPARWRGSRNPVEQVRWSDAVRYCNARSSAEGFQPCYDLETWACDLGASGYRLPTEAEWEYACRAGTGSRYVFGAEPKKLKHYAWMKENSGGRSRPVGKKLPNAWGLYDMYGNVWEWCNDFYAVDYYEESPKANPKGPEEGDNKVLRGGCWKSGPEECRSSYRYNEAPGYTDICFGYDIYGFRCVRSLQP